MPSPPLFTFVIPTFNPGDKLALTIDSILAQSEGDVQIWVQDGGSTDQTLAYLRNRTDIEWQSAPDAGLYDAMNRGIQNSNGTWIVCYGAGDTLSEGALEQLRPVATEFRNTTAVIYGDTFFHTQNKRRGHIYTRLQLRKDMPCHQATFYHRRVFDLVGLYDVRYKISADYAFAIVCWGEPRIKKIYRPILIARYEGGGISDHAVDMTFLKEDYLPHVEKHLGKIALWMKLVEDPILNRVLRPIKRKVEGMRNK